MLHVGLEWYVAHAWWDGFEGPAARQPAGRGINVFQAACKLLRT